MLGRLFSLVILCILLLAAWHLLFHPNFFFVWQPNASAAALARFDLVDPETAPAEKKPLVMLGYHLMMETQKYAPGYSGDRITCSNCHFSGGNTLGGVNGGISLVGVTKRYPKKIPGNADYTLADRINACFERSMNGKPLPKDSDLMKALIAYMEWISHDMTHFKTLPWLGRKELRVLHVPDSANGAKIFAASCASCHGDDGQGQPRPDELGYPPLWGDHSFNNAAGMNKLPTLAAFVYDNMPYQDPGLTVEDAHDVAAFIISQPRPQEIAQP